MAVFSIRNTYLWPPEHDPIFLMESVILLGALEGLIITLLILSKRRKVVSDYLLSVFFLLYSVNTLLSYFEIYNRSHGFPYPMMVFVSSPLLFLHGPVIWIYVKSLTHQHFSFKPVYLLHLVPFILCVLNLTIQIYTLPVSDKIEVLISESFKNRPDYMMTVVAMALSPFIYFSWSILLIKRYNQKIKGYFSETSNYDLTWLRVLMIASVIVYTIIYTEFIVDLVFPLASFVWMHKVSFMLGSVYIIFLGFFGHKQGNLFSDKPIPIELSEPKPLLKENYSLDKSENDFIHELLAYMKEKKPFLIAEITLPSLAGDLSVTPEYLSKIINSRLGKNFYDFINHYRIEEFKNQCTLRSNKNLTLIGIAFDCGFNSKATFNRVFKNATGETPGDYVRRSH